MLPGIQISLKLRDKPAPDWLSLAGTTKCTERERLAQKAEDVLRLFGRQSRGGQFLGRAHQALRRPIPLLEARLEGGQSVMRCAVGDGARSLLLLSLLTAKCGCVVLALCMSLQEKAQAAGDGGQVSLFLSLRHLDKCTFPLSAT